LREFNARYQAGRAAVLARGEGFIAYKVAEARLRRALIPLLVGRALDRTGAIVVRSGAAIRNKRTWPARAGLYRHKFGSSQWTSNGRALPLR
jgi:hypothetical protein